MAFNLAATKYKAQQAIHKTLAVSCTYQDDTMSSPVSTVTIDGVTSPLVARWGNKQHLFGDLQGEGYAQTIEAADHIIFEQAVSDQLVIKRGCKVYFADYDMLFILDVREPNNGPFSETWRVIRA